MSSQQQIASQQQLPRQPAARQQSMQMPAPSTPHLNQHFVCTYMSLVTNINTEV